jgi:hypothetical protein
LFFSVWEDETARLPLLALVRGVFEPGGQRLLRDGVMRVVFGPVAMGLELDEPERRMSLVASQMAGLVMVRYVLEAEPLASAPVDQLVATYAPVIQGYLSGALP